uniref:Uncharacterized protein n=1 Tax=Caenorhabditis japonica TaxID=281687 RepID=A0A8R1EBW3_CAEJA
MTADEVSNLNENDGKDENEQVKKSGLKTGSRRLLIYGIASYDTPIFRSFSLAAERHNFVRFLLIFGARKKAPK